MRNNISKINWILINQLAIGPQPSNKSDLNFLKQNNIRTIFSVCYEDEILIPNEIKNFFHHNVFSLPDHKKGCLPTKKEINKIILILHDLISLGPVYIHCFAGVERSPLISMAYLVKFRNLKPQQALDYLMQVHPGTNPLTKQLNLLSEINI